MAEDFFWSLKNNIDAEFRSLSVGLSQITDEDLSDKVYLYYSRKIDSLQDLFDRISEVNKELVLDQTNPNLYTLLKAKEELSHTYGQFSRLRNQFFNRFSKNKNRDAEDLPRQRAVMDEAEALPEEELIPEIPEEEEPEIEEIFFDPDEEKAEKNREHAARQKKLADEARKRDQRYAEQRYRQEEAARLGVRINEGQSFSEADLQRERYRQEEERITQARQYEERIRSENETMRAHRERMDRSQQFEHIDRQHIDMSREGIGRPAGEYYPPASDQPFDLYRAALGSVPYGPHLAGNYSYSGFPESAPAEFRRNEADDAPTHHQPEGYSSHYSQEFIPPQFTPEGVTPSQTFDTTPQQPSPGYSGGSSYEFIPLQFTPDGVVPAQEASRPHWDHTADSNARIYSALTSNYSDSVQAPAAVSSAVEVQMRFNVERARMACLEAQGTEQYASKVHEYIQQRNSLSEYRAAVRSGSLRVEDPPPPAFTPPPSMPKSGNSVVYSFTPGGVKAETVENGRLTGNSYEFINPGIKTRTAYSVNNPMVVSSAYEEAIINKMRQATDSVSAAVSGTDPHSHAVDPVQTKLYTDAYLAFQRAKKEGTVVVDTARKDGEMPDYSAWQQRHLAQQSGKLPGGATPFVTGQPIGTPLERLERTDVKTTSTNAFNLSYRLKQQTMVSLYAKQIGSTIENWSVGATLMASRKLYNMAQKGDDNVLSTMEQGRMYFTTAAGIVLAIHAGQPTKFLETSVANAASAEFLMFGTKSLMTDKQLSSALHNSMRTARELEPRIQELERQMAPFNDKMNLFAQENPHLDKTMALDKASKRQFEKLSAELEQLRGEHKAANQNMNIFKQQQKLRHEAKLEEKILGSLEQDGKLFQDPKKIREIAQRVNDETKEALRKKYGHIKFNENGKDISLIKATDKSIALEIDRLKLEGKALKKQIKALEAKGASLTLSERKLLAQLKEEAKKVGMKIAPLEGIARGRADLKFMNDKYDAIVKTAYKNRGRITNALFVLKGFMSRPLQAGYDSNTEGLEWILDKATNRYVHIIVKNSFKASMFVGKAGLNLVAPGSVDAAAMAVNIAKESAIIKANAAKATIKTAVKTSIHMAGHGVYTSVPAGIRTKIDGVADFGRAAQSGYNAVAVGIKNRVFQAQAWLANSRLGQGVAAVARFNREAMDVLKGILSTMKGAALKGLAAFSLFFLIIGLVSSALGMAGGAAGGSIIASPFESEDGKIDLSPYMKIIQKEDQKFQKKINAYINDEDYENVTVHYNGDANNTKHMLSMMAVRMNQELDLEKNALIEDYLISLYQASHTYTTEKHKYKCPGCEEREVVDTWIDKYGEVHTRYEYNPETEEYEEVYVTEVYCEGHTDLTIYITVLTFDEIFNADNSSLGSITLVGSEIKQKVWNYLKAKGISDLHAAAIMGNIEHESGFDPNKIEKGSGVGYGLCQWSYSRRTQLEAYAAALGRSPSDLLTQLNFFWMEYFPGASSTYADYQWISSSYPYSDFIAADTIQEATTIFCRGWERPGIPHLDRRINSALAYYSLYAGTDGSDYETEDSGSSAENTAFSWTPANVEWCKLIYSMNWNELYSGIYDYGGILESGELIVKGDFMWPVASTNITSPFGYRTHPVTGETGTFHYGVDIGVGTGTPVHAAADGTVTTSTFSSSAGNYLVVDHGNGVKTRYLHNSVLCVNRGDKVKRGDVIAYSGNTGTSTGAHLHFEFIVNGTCIDPCVQFDID